MDIKETFEWSVGENFIRWYNVQHETNFAFSSKQEHPDLTYRDDNAVLNVEVTSAYYDGTNQARFLWQNARGAPNAPKGWGGVNITSDLVENISQAISKKCAKNYGPDCVLVVEVTAFLTGADEIEELLGDINVPSSHNFQGFYLTGDFPWTSNSQGGYRCWRLGKPQNRT